MSSKVSWNISGHLLASINIFLALNNMHTGHTALIASSRYSSSLGTFFRAVHVLLPPLISLVVSATAILAPEFAAGKPNSTKFLVPMAVFLGLNAYNLMNVNSIPINSSRSVSNIVEAIVISSFLFASASIIYIGDDSESAWWLSLKPWTCISKEDTKDDDLYNAPPFGTVQLPPFQLPSHPPPLPLHPAYPPNGQHQVIY